ncbi:hypothetical protein FHW92_002496 [Novosphingobium sp. SG707]|nr:hypothetical protein [Novosphingobium sp. SG707]
MKVASVSKVTTIGLDIAKSSFHAHGADERGGAVFSRKLSRSKLLEFFARQRAYLVAMEACSGAHPWATEVAQLGHEVQLIPPIYVKPLVEFVVGFDAGAGAIRKMPPGHRSCCRCAAVAAATPGTQVKQSRHRNWPYIQVRRSAAERHGFEQFGR